MDWTATKASAAKFIHRSDIDWDALQPLALDDVDQVLSVQENEGAASLPLVASALANIFAADLPPDFARARSVFDDAGVELTLTDINGLIARPGATRFVAVSGGKLYGYITAAAMVYTRRTPLLAAGSDHNYLSDRYSPVLLYALLKHACHMTQDFEARDAHQNAFDYAAGMANSNYALATLGPGAEVRSPYLAVGN